ncbi:MAG: flagellar basal body L-ring protein FlgH [Calditrichaeota bacterium]|nr:flagellar basal body L-ring protein FlgH [Calditrichota bacterium]
MSQKDDRELLFWLMLLSMCLLASLTLAQPPAVSSVSASRPAPTSLFADQRAFRPGDVVTILLMEYTTGSNEASTNADLEHLIEATNAGSGSLASIPALGLKAGLSSDQKARGGTSRSGTLRGKMAARVVEIMPNGNLRLEGMRRINVNGEEQTTILTGVVRPRDILSDNSVYSYLIADAAISYKGKGVVDEAQRPGILLRFINWLF